MGPAGESSGPKHQCVSMANAHASLPPAKNQHEPFLKKSYIRRERTMQHQFQGDWLLKAIGPSCDHLADQRAAAGQQQKRKHHLGTSVGTGISDWGETLEGRPVATLVFTKKTRQNKTIREQKLKKGIFERGTSQHCTKKQHFFPPLLPVLMEWKALSEFILKSINKCLTSITMHY